MSQDELYHHGILGQKWGIRRFQNKDGTLTKAGKDRYSTSTPPNTVLLKDYSGPCMFVSSNKNMTELTPRVPKNYFTEHGYEDSNTSRVSFAPSIDKCLAGLSQNLDGKTFTVYQPDDVSKYKVFKPNNKAVPDSSITDEMWICEPVKLKAVGTITITGNKGADGKVFTYGDHQAELYDDWTYDFLEKDSLSHHGILGQKWGVRRFQNKDGSLTSAGKQHALEQRNIARNKPYTDDINDVVNTLSKKEKDFLGASEKEDWINKNYENDTLKEKAVSFVTKVGDTPVSFAEVWTNGGRVGQIAVATRNGSEFRGKGYASKNIKDAIAWCDKYGNKSIDELEWIADRNNIASVNLGKKYGFVEDDPNKHGHNWNTDWSKEYAIMYRPVKRGGK